MGLKWIVYPILVAVILAAFPVNVHSPESYDLGARGYECKVIALVNHTIYDEIEPALKSLQDVMLKNNYGCRIITKDAGRMNPEEIRALLEEEYSTSGISGAVLVGNIPLKKYHDNNTSEVIEFPYYYMDLNGQWIDSDGDGIIDTPSGDYLPEIYVGIVRSSGDGNNVTEIKGYIERVEKYIQGDFTPMLKSGVFLDNDFSMLWDSVVYSSAEYAYIGVDAVSINRTTSQRFLHFLSENYAYAYFVVHSDGKSYYIKNGSRTERVDASQIPDARALFYTDLSCYASSFEKGGVANRLLMKSDSISLGVLTYTAEGIPDALAGYHRRIGEGKSFGDTLVGYMREENLGVEDFNSRMAMLSYLGFPFLKPWRPHGYRDIGQISIDGDEELMRYAKMYGWKGDGSADSPITIEKVSIFNASAFIAIYINNVTLHLRIRDVILLNQKYGVFVENSANVSIEHSSFHYSSILVLSSREVAIKGNSMESINSMCAVEVDNSTEVDVTDNRIEGAFTGIGVHGESYPVWVGQNITWRLRYAENINVSHNSIRGLAGIWLYITSNSSVFRNNVDFGFYGLDVAHSTSNEIRQNNFTINFSAGYWENMPLPHVPGHYLVRIWDAWNNRIWENNFMYKGNPGDGMNLSDLFQIVYDDEFGGEKTNNMWNLTRGNYWQWWAEANDTNNGNNDGIVDYPLVIDENNTDYRPLKQPYRWWREGKESELNSVIIYSISLAVLAAVVIVIILRRR